MIITVPPVVTASLRGGGGGICPTFHPTTVLEATLCDIPLVTNTEVPLSLRESPRHLVVERLVLVDEEEAEKVEEESIMALKRKRRQESSTSTHVDESIESN